MNKKTAFTLTEIVIVLAILGALALILIPNMFKMMPDDHIIKYKKAFYTVQEIVNDMVNDPNTCSSIDDSRGEVSDEPLTTCKKSNGDWRNIGEEICNRMATKEDGACESLDSVETTNGMKWDFSGLGDSDGFEDSIITVHIDGGNTDKDSYQIKVMSTGRVIPGESNGEADLLTKDVKE